MLVVLQPEEHVYFMTAVAILLRLWYPSIQSVLMDGCSLNTVTQCSISATVNYKAAKASVIELSIEAYTVSAITVLRFHEPS